VIDGTLEHRDCALVQVEAALLNSLEEPDLSPLQADQVELLLWSLAARWGEVFVSR